MFLLLFIQISQQLISFESGLFSRFDHLENGDIFICFHDELRTQVVSFSQSFGNVPQIILEAVKFDFQKNKVDYRVQILIITRENFTLHLDCLFDYYSWGTQLRWYAFDDQRIQVISFFNQLVIENKTITFQKNFNANKCFVSLVSLGYQSATNFTIFLDSQTLKNITFRIILDQSQSGLIQIGYQIICTIQNALINMGLFYAENSMQQNTLPIMVDKWFVSPFYQINWKYTDVLRLVKNLISNSTHVTAILNSWQLTIFSSTIQQYWISYKFTTIFTPLICEKISKTQIQDFQQSELYNFQIEITELNLHYRYVGVYNYLVDKSINTLNIIIYSKCMKGKQITGKFKKCIHDCSNYNLSQNCYGEINQIKFTTRFVSTINSYQELILTITEIDCQINQL